MHLAFCMSNRFGARIRKTQVCMSVLKNFCVDTCNFIFKWHSVSSLYLAFENYSPKRVCICGAYEEKVSPYAHLTYGEQPIAIWSDLRSLRHEFLPASQSRHTFSVLSNICETHRRKKLNWFRIIDCRSTCHSKTGNRKTQGPRQGRYSQTCKCWWRRRF